MEYKNLAAACIDLIARDVAKYEPIIYQKGDIDKKPRNHAILSLLESPNKATTKSEFLISHESFLLLTGDSFWYIARGEQTSRPREIYLLRPDLVEEVVDDDRRSETFGEIIGYVYSPRPDIKIPLELNEIIHFRSFNPMNSHRGIGAIEKYLLYIDTEQNISEFQNGFIKNQATPSGVLNVKNKISKENFNKLKKKWLEAHAGLTNTGKTLFIRNSEVEFTKIGLAINELDLGNIKPMARDDVLTAFNVPEALLGKSDSVGLGRANIETIEYNFAKRNIDPRFDILDDGIQAMINLIYKDRDLRVAHVNKIPRDKEFELKTKTESVGRWHTVNEIRESEGLEPVKGGDQLYYNFNQVPIGEDLQQNNNVQNDFGSITVITKKHEQTVLEYANALDKVERQLQKPYGKAIDKYLDHQESEVLDLARNIFKKVKSIDSVLDVIFGDTGEAYTILQNSLLISLVNAFEESGSIALEYLGLPSSNFVIDQAQRDYIFGSTDRLLKSFNEQTANRIQQQLAQAIANGESIADITARIESVYEEAKGYRAERIARTESHKAVNYGTAQAYQQEGYRKIKWIALPDACEFCASMDGKIVTIDQPFIPKGMPIEGTDGGEYIADYEDVAYADLHPHCDCRLEPIRESKGAKPDKTKLIEEKQEQNNIEAIQSKFDKINEKLEEKIITPALIDDKVKDIYDDIYSKIVEVTNNKLEAIEDKILETLE